LKELSLNILDIAENSVKAKATLTYIKIVETAETVEVTISDNGHGMTKEILQNVTNPFCTTRTTRKVGLGIPLLKLSAEQTGGYVTVTSRHESEYPDSHGTCTRAFYYKNHIDMTPIGDITATVVALIQCNPDLDFVFNHETEKGTVSLDTRELKEVLGDIPLNTAEVIVWMGENLSEQYKEIN
jgi:nitrogen fixation/metabolism regulation signal transduction histidine kinase